MSRGHQWTVSQSEERMGSKGNAAWAATKTVEENGTKQETYEVRERPESSK